MNELLRRALGTMTRQADVRPVIVKSTILTIIAAGSAVGYFHYLVFVVSGGGGLTGQDPWTSLMIELVLLTFVLFLSALVGFSFSERLDLPGFGQFREFIRALPILVVGGIAMVAISYVVFDRYFFAISPVSIPRGTFYLVTIPLKAALADETILRLGLVTIGVSLTKNKTAGVILMSAVSSLFTVKYFEFIGIPFALDHFYIIYLLLSFLGNIILGWLFVTRGLAYCMALKFVIGCKYFLIPWLDV
ncbi:MAG: hypothetical protein JW765_04165 [Deltaproteobacteria bacterium]|nr:hypothetical protein [Candidatus Zymogenaceae bacterium]